MSDDGSWMMGAGRWKLKEIINKHEFQRFSRIKN
jgi:hypothetical protein